MLPPAALLLSEHTSIGARQEEDREAGNWRAQHQGYFQSCHVLHFLTATGILAFILGESKTPCSLSCPNQNQNQTKQTKKKQKQKT